MRKGSGENQTKTEVVVLDIERKVLLSTGSLIYRLPLREISAIVAEAGLDGLEIVLNHKALREVNEKGKQLFRSLEAPVLSLHAPYHSIRALGSLESCLKTTIDIARKNGIRRVVFHPPGFPLLQPKFSYFFLKTRDFREIAGKDIVLTIENLPKTKLPVILRDPIQMREFLKERNLFLTLDCCHYASWGRPPVEALEIFGSLIKSIHLANTHQCFIDSHQPPHEGCIDMASLLQKLALSGFDGDVYLVLEIDFGLKSEDEVKRVIVDSLGFLKENLNSNTSSRN